MKDEAVSESEEQTSRRVWGTRNFFVKCGKDAYENLLDKMKGVTDEDKRHLKRLAWLNEKMRGKAKLMHDITGDEYAAEKAALFQRIFKVPYAYVSKQKHLEVK